MGICSFSSTRLSGIRKLLYDLCWFHVLHSWKAEEWSGVVKLIMPQGPLGSSTKYQLLRRLEGIRGLDSHFTSRDPFDGVTAQEHSHPRERENQGALIWGPSATGQKEDPPILCPRRQSGKLDKSISKLVLSPCEVPSIVPGTVSQSCYE